MLSTIDAVTAFGDNPSAFLALNSEKAAFTTPGLAGFVAYRQHGRYLVQFAGAFAPPADYPALLRGFLEYAARQGRRVVAIQLQRADAEIYAAHGFTVNQVGASYAVRLADFSLRGGRFMRLRNKISRARRSGLTVDEVAVEEYEPRLAELDRQWLRAKGRHVRPLRFLVGERTGPLQRHRRLFVGRCGEQVLAYISYSPAGGCRPGWLHDLSRRRQDAAPGVMETINLTALERFQAEGAQWLHFGFTPFTGLDPAHEVAGASRFIARLVRLLAAHGDAIYPARTQLAYKEKWGPHVVLPEYLAFHGRPGLGAVWSLLRTANII
ncbi:MAG TPA: DUF2156 domain-containing protein [Micromonosporaceae bacterium]|nr:DUF2156 domain-containing protein [Micromonosporaceae bacterium]